MESNHVQYIFSSADQQPRYTRHVLFTPPKSMKSFKKSFFPYFCLVPGLPKPSKIKYKFREDETVKLNQRKRNVQRDCKTSLPNSNSKPKEKQRFCGEQSGVVYIQTGRKKNKTTDSLQAAFLSPPPLIKQNKNEPSNGTSSL
jgi:hypothetical protein